MLQAVLARWERKMMAVMEFQYSKRQGLHHLVLAEP
jgi:hypothetical protein